MPPKLFRFTNVLGNVLIFSVRDNLPVPLVLRQYECRGDNALELLRRLVALDPARFNHRTGVIFYEDAPPPLDREWLNYELRFCCTKVQGEPSLYLPFPDGYALSWVQTRLPDGDALIRDFLASEEQFIDGRVFWLGADTHPSRRALVNLAARHPDTMDCSLMAWDRSNPTLLQSSQFISLWDHRHYKYLVDCPGWGYSGRLRWLIASGRPVFIVNRPFVEHWHEKLQPWVHFVPVKDDLSDLLAAHARIEESPELYDSICWNARQFARDHLLLDKQLQASLAAVQNFPQSPLIDLTSMQDSPDFLVLHSDPGFDPAVVYDVDVAMPVCGEGKYKRRLESFKRAGLFNLAGLHVHLTLIGGPGDWEQRESIKAGWPEGCAVTLLVIGHARPLPKANAYYLWQRESKLRARWRLRVDDDSMTDVGGMLRDADARYGSTAVHLMTDPYINGSGIAPLVRCMQEQGVELAVTMHEHECSLTSAEAMRQVFACKPALDFLRASTVYVHQQSDQTLALAMLAANIPLAIHPRTSKDFHPDQLSLVGGDLLHIHYVDWEKPGYAAMAAALVQGERHSLEGFGFKTLIDRPMAFGRCIERVMAELVLLADGRVDGASSENEVRWRLLEDTLLLTRSNGTATTIFHTLLVHGPRRWLLGPYLFDTFTHFLRLA